MKQDFEEVYAKNFPFWKDLARDDKDYLLSTSVATHFAKGETIHDGNECTGVIAIKSGCLRIYILSEDGKEITLYRLGEGEVCMLSASCALQSITFDVMVCAEEESDCHVISGPAFAAVSERNDKVKIFTLETATSRFSDVMWAMQRILFMSIEKRLAIFLMDESATLGSDIIPLTHEQIGKYMGSAREVVSRTLKHFAKEGLVEMSRKGVKLLDKRTLRRMTL